MRRNWSRTNLRTQSRRCANSSHRHLDTDRSNKAVDAEPCRSRDEEGRLARPGRTAEIHVPGEKCATRTTRCEARVRVRSASVSVAGSGPRTREQLAWDTVYIKIHGMTFPLLLCLSRIYKSLRSIKAWMIPEGNEETTIMADKLYTALSAAVAFCSIFHDPPLSSS